MLHLSGRTPLEGAKVKFLKPGDLNRPRMGEADARRLARTEQGAHIHALDLREHTRT